MLDFKWPKKPRGFHMLPAHLIPGMGSPPAKELTIRINLDLFITEEVANKIYQLIDYDILKANGH